MSKFSARLFILEMTNSKIYFCSFGEGKPVIFLHGILGTHSQWIPFVKDFSDCRLIFPDLPNHGRSFHIPSMNYDEFAKILHEWILSLNINNITLVGHSFGGKVAVKLFQNYPNLFQKLILIDSSNERLSTPSSINLWINAIKKIPLHLYSTYSEAKIFFEKEGIPEQEQELLLKNIQREKNRLSWRANISEITENIGLILEEIRITFPITTPTYLIRGEFSTHISNNTISKMKENFPLLKDTVINCSGHWVHVDNKTEFTQTMLSFLNE